VLYIQGSDSGSSSPICVERKQHSGGRHRKQKTPKSETSSDPATPVASDSPLVEDASSSVATSSAAASPDRMPTSTRTRKNKEKYQVEHHVKSCNY